MICDSKPVNRTIFKAIEPPTTARDNPGKRVFCRFSAPMQRFIISLLLFAGSIVIGVVILLATGSVVIPK